MEIQEKYIIVKNKTVYKVNKIHKNIVNCTILSSTGRKRDFFIDELKPYFLQFDQKINLDNGAGYTKRFTVKNIYYQEGKIIITCRHMGNIDIETDFEETELIKLFKNFAE